MNSRTSARTQKINSIGRFAAGFAHDFNNLLMAITANLDITRRKLESRDILLEEVSLALRACGHASQITKQLMNYSSIGQEQLPVVTPASITELVEEAVEIAFRGSQVQLILSIDPGIPMVKMDGSQIHQVLNNPLLNAEQSMPEGGVIKIRIRSGTTHRPPTRPTGGGGDRDPRPGRDRQGGPEQVLEPYFTTKEMGNGLGLTTAYWIVKHHDGLMEIESAPGSGTMVRSPFRLRGAGSPAESPARSQPVQADGAGHGRRRPGAFGAGVDARVAGAPGSPAQREEAAGTLIRWSRSELPPIDVLVLDLVAPAAGRSGRSIGLEVDPAVRAVVSTDQQTLVEDYASHGFVGALRKPYTVDELQARRPRPARSIPPGFTRSNGRNAAPALRGHRRDRTGMTRRFSRSRPRAAGRDRRPRPHCCRRCRRCSTLPPRRRDPSWRAAGSGRPR